MIRVLFFGPVAERVGVRELELPFRDGMGWREVRDALQPRYPDAFALVSVVAVDGRRVDETSEQDVIPLVDGAEIVFMSRFSGG